MLWVSLYPGLLQNSELEMIDFDKILLLRYVLLSACR